MPLYAHDLSFILKGVASIGLQELLLLSGADGFPAALATDAAALAGEQDALDHPLAKVCPWENGVGGESTKSKHPLVKGAHLIGGATASPMTVGARRTYTITAVSKGDQRIGLELLLHQGHVVYKGSVVAEASVEEETEAVMGAETEGLHSWKLFCKRLTRTLARKILMQSGMINGITHMPRTAVKPMAPVVWV